MWGSKFASTRGEPSRGVVRLLARTSGEDIPRRSSSPARPLSFWVFGEGLRVSSEAAFVERIGWATRQNPRPLEVVGGDNRRLRPSTTGVALQVRGGGRSGRIVPSGSGFSAFSSWSQMLDDERGGPVLALGFRAASSRGRGNALPWRTSSGQNAVAPSCHPGLDSTDRFRSQVCRWLTSGSSSQVPSEPWQCVGPHSKGRHRGDWRRWRAPRTCQDPPGEEPVIWVIMG